MLEPLKVNHQWRAVLLERGGQGYSFPGKLTPYLREEYARPAVYRWRVHPADSGQKEEVYIGEAEVLTKRIRGVLHAAKSRKRDGTSYRLKVLFRERVNAGKLVFLDWLDFEPFEIECVRFSKDELWDPFRRKCVENLFLTISSAQEERLLNYYADPINKVMKKFLGMDISSKRLRQALELVRQRGLGHAARS